MSFGLPIEVVKWLTTLNLQHHIQHPKWDLANGYTVADILSKYFPYGFELYHFDTGLSATRRKQNWEMIHLILHKKGLKIPMKLMEGTINHRDDAAKLLLIYLYELLNKQKVKAPFPLVNNNFTDKLYQRSLPLYARANAVSQVRTLLREEEVRIYFFPSVDTKERKVEKIISMHKLELKRLKKQHKDYFQCKPTICERIPRQEPKPSTSQFSSMRTRSIKHGRPEPSTVSVFSMKNIADLAKLHH